MSEILNDVTGRLVGNYTAEKNNNYMKLNIQLFLDCIYEPNKRIIKGFDFNK
jgi:hypothetical protein